MVLLAPPTEESGWDPQLPSRRRGLPGCGPEHDGGPARSRQTKQGSGVASPHPGRTGGRGGRERGTDRMLVLACGSVRWSDPEKIRKRLEELPEDTFLVHGDIGSADNHIQKVWRSLGRRSAKLKAEKERSDEAIVRWARNIMSMKPGLVLAFKRNRSPGVDIILANAKAAAIPFEVVWQYKAAVAPLPEGS